MIHTVLPVIMGELDQFIRRRSPVPEPKARVTLSELMSLDGAALVEEDGVVCTLVNVEQERVNINHRPAQQFRVNPPISLNLHVLLSAHFRSANNYKEALKSLSLIIAFFQGKQVFTPENTPGLPAGIEKISSELVNLDMRELSNFWTAVGSKHLPSVIYKLRMISISEEMILEEIPEIRGLDTEGNVQAGS